MDVYARNNIKVVGAGGAVDGPLIVLAHGFGCDQQLWCLVVDRLKSEFRLLLIDHVGSGESDPASWDAQKYSSLAGYAADVVDIVIDELLESLELNYLGWSHAMAPVIMGTPDRPELQDELAETFCRNNPAHTRVFARATFLSDNRNDLARISVPTLVIECAQDAIAPREVGAFVHERIPGSRLVTVDATGHCPQVSAPDATASAIADFVRSTRP